MNQETSMESLPELYRPDLPPMKHQADAVSLGWQREGYGYLLEMGLGKSRVVIDDFCLNHMENEVDGLLLIAPKSVYTNWTRISDDNPGELQKWIWSELSATARIYTYRAGKTKKEAEQVNSVMDPTAPGIRVLAINIEALAQTRDAEEIARKFMRAHRTMMVIDESTAIKDKGSQRTKICLRLAPLAAKRRILTGSPSTGSMADLWSQFEFLGPKQALLGLRTFTAFQARYCVMREIHVAGGRKIKTEVGSQNVDELRGVVAKHSFRRRKRECLDLPEKTYERREIELTKDQVRAYEELRRHAMTIVNDAEVTTDIVITQMMRMHQVVCGHVTTDEGRVVHLANNRVKELLNVVRTSGERQCVIWCNYRADVEVVVDALVREFGPESVSQWHGGLRMEERERQEGAFVAGDSRFLVATQSSGARGRTWTCANLVIYYSNNYDLELREQSEDRTHRIGQASTVTYVDLVCPKTVDEKIIEALRAKKSVVRQVLNDGVVAWI